MNHLFYAHHRNNPVYVVWIEISIICALKIHFTFYTQLANF